MSKILVSCTELMMIHFLVPHINNLVEKGYSVDVACANVGGRICELKTLLDDTVNIYEVESQRSPLAIKANIKGYKTLKNIIGNGHYDFIWTNEPVMSVITRLAAKKDNAKVMYLVHGFHFYKGASLKNWILFYPIERFMIRYTDILTTISKEDYNRALKWKIKNLNYIHGIGLDTKKFKNTILDKTKKRKELDIPADSVILLSVGELGKHKNHEVAIRAFAKIHANNAYYLIVGQGELKDYYIRLCKELNIEDKVRFIGYRSDINELCKMSDVYVFPSRREGLGIAALEGMSSGLPLICSYVNGIRDYSEDGKTGFCLDVDDIEGFAKAMSILIDNKDMREKMGNYNLKIVKNFDIENSKDEIISIIRKALD